MATIRLANGGDLGVKLSLEEVKGVLGGDADFVELPGDDGPVLVRPSAVIAIIEDSKRGTAGFRVGAATAG
ncbi:MAG: hypothetical protein ACREN2_05360 [Candidatus Dormibacteria bacterium]